MHPLALPVFFAGLLTFLAPCTLPLLPAYLGFISGSTTGVLNRENRMVLRNSIMLNGVLYVVGFSVVFILLGMAVGLGGAFLIAYRPYLSRIGGLFVILFGLFMLGVLRMRALNIEHRIGALVHLTPGKPVSALLFGATFSLGWTPCLGPILGSVLTVASATATVGQGALLLTIYSLGLAVPFLAIAFSAGSAVTYFKKITPFLGVIEKIGGAALVVLGFLMLTNTYGRYVGFFYQWFNILNYQELLKYF
ncbi:MAG: hypothetical protein A3B30_02350 [Candidatus Komeilibacteria bacterium RIFCSPLOWO2_01_FULL_52_15]|uniref:Cytochrome C biogenesis protein transmembrane domain-containing protein n=2 Tax=Candidatus Komeiliibacteriota TaxID=1817908 RepID=A0A1G2BRV6_9BACT|nr:MAG: hypothetical protein A2677_03880 [Candidatus Komeilibacteria bacterium RIFCSPHIGHO2_01_FULL_52_14]OGY91915.1 MAG: hypothetical protein A3B30_02350 [Candidatus Komeilibacteria bacterium RIFCSPLOWO2_01_FULL_52_15]